MFWGKGGHQPSIYGDGAFDLNGTAATPGYV